MGTTAEKLEYLAQTKEDIKQAIIDAGGDVSDTDTFRSYADKIGDLTWVVWNGSKLVIKQVYSATASGEDLTLE